MSSICVIKEDGRHYRNPYLKSQLQTDTNIVDPSTNDIHEDFKASIKENIDTLMTHLDKHKKEWISKDDSSLYTGNSGIAYMYYFYGKKFNDESYITKATELIEKSVAHKREITFLTGEAGRLSLGAVIYHEANNEDKYEEMLLRLQSIFDYAAASSYDELLYGRVGYLYALLFVNKYIPDKPIEEDLIRGTLNCILKTGRAYAKDSKYDTPLMYSWHESEYLGGAHGLAGILYILLQARDHLTESELKNDIEPSIKFLMSLRHSSGNFPSSIGNKSDTLVHWCHGAPSMTQLFALAYEVFGNEEYLEVAKVCGDVVWHRGLLKKGCGICHGVSGNAYTFLCLYQATKDLRHLYRACKFAGWCFDYQEKQNRIPDRPYSLFEGLAGIIYFLIDMTEPSLAKFPGYTL